MGNYDYHEYENYLYLKKGDNDVTGECFDLTFFCLKENFNDEVLSLFKEVTKCSFSLNNPYFVYAYWYDKDYIEIEVGIQKLVFNNDNFTETLKNLSSFVGCVFEKIPVFDFASGIYELTEDYIGGVNCYKDLMSVILKDFPLCFIRSNFAYNGKKIAIQSKDCICIYNDDVQALF